MVTEINGFQKSNLDDIRMIDDGMILREVYGHTSKAGVGKQGLASKGFSFTVRCVKNC